MTETVTFTGRLLRRDDPEYDEARAARVTGTGTFRGRLLRRDDPEYDEARVDGVFNARHPDRRPVAILLAESENDVLAGVRLARDEGWAGAGRSGGHSW